MTRGDPRDLAGAVSDGHYGSMTGASESRRLSQPDNGETRRWMMGCDLSQGRDRGEPRD